MGIQGKLFNQHLNKNIHIYIYYRFLVENEKKEVYLIHANVDGDIVIVNSKYVSEKWRIEK